MNRNLFYLFFIASLISLGSLALPGRAAAAGPELGRPVEAGEDGRVEIPLEVYRRLLASSEPPGPGPQRHALGRAEVEVTVDDVDGRATASVVASLELQVLVDEWVLVPVLPIGTAVASATVDGEPIQLMTTPRGLAWAIAEAGRYRMTLRYPIDAMRSDAGYTASIPLPEAAATSFRARLPGSGLDAALIPGAGIEVRNDAGRTLVQGTLPATRGVQLSWRARDAVAWAISRAHYRGKLVGDAIVWQADLDVELDRDEPVSLPLLAQHVTLNALRVDGEPAAITLADGRFAARLAGRGPHRVELAFQVEVGDRQGRPGVALAVPAIPISRFEVELPGDKAVTVEPATNVSHERDGTATRATFHVPMRESLAFSWGDAIPDDIATEVRAHASVLHAVRVDEGMLVVDAAVEIDVTRGELAVIELSLPADVQVGRVTAPGAGLVDWRIARDAEGGTQRLSVFLDAALSGAIALRLQYDRPIEGEALEIPVLAVPGVDRHRGMIALLATREVALEPVAFESLTAVGENQLPAGFRQGIDHTVAHTFKYAQTRPRLTAALAIPERVAGKLDVEIDTLISVTDVTVQGAASVRVQVKSGTIDSLRLTLPDDVDLLSLTSPSLRTWRVVSEQGERFVDVEFTQEMEGHFRLETGYERIIADVDGEVVVPTLGVVGAEVEQGRIAVEALAAVEVRVARAEHLSSLDPADLPRQLILKTTNPILLAYKTVHADDPHLLALRMTRHREVAVQGAAIDRADYRTLVTADGLAVTTARFAVRNRAQQFLRVRLPEGSTVWSASVDGRPEKPAISDGAGEEGGEAPSAHPPEILIRVISSAEPFDVELVYATPMPEMGSFGSVDAALPRPGMVVTRSRWSVFLPESRRYGTPRSNLTAVVSGQHLDGAGLARELAMGRDGRSAAVVGPLQIAVPDAGVQFTFEKLYANQSEDAAAISIPYRSLAATRIGEVLSLLSVACIALAFALATGRVLRGRPALAGVAALAGVTGLGVSLGSLGADVRGVLAMAIVLGVGSGIALAWDRRRTPGSGEAEHGTVA